MRDKILEILKKENRKLNSKEILDFIKSNGTVEDLRDVIDELDSMVSDGILRTASANSYFFNDLVTGTLDVHDRGNAHLLMKDGEDIFIRSNNLKGACDKDLVSITVNNKTNEGRVVKVLKRSLGKGIGEVVNDDGNIKVISLDKDLPYDVEIEDSELNLVDGMLVHLSYVKDINKNKVLAKVDKVITHKNAPGKESQIALIASEFGLRLEFPEEVIKEAESMPKKLSEEMISEGLKEGRVDFRNDIIFTIDGKDTKDIDDAISLKMLSNGNYLLGVHIADVSHYVKEGSELFKEAELRGNSNYLGNKVIPMLPVELSNGICSLNPNEDRFTESCIMEIDHSGGVVDKKICKGIIRSRKKMNYDAVEDLIEGKDTIETVDYKGLEYIANEKDTLDSIAFENNMSKVELLKYNLENKEGIDCSKMSTEEILSYEKKYEVKKGSTILVPCSVIIQNMDALSKVLSAYKRRRGELTFESDETYIKMNENDEVIDILPRVQRDAERLIENFMVVANESVASYLTTYKVATYRIHEKPKMKKMEDYLTFLHLLGYSVPVKINTSNVSSKDCQKLLDYLKTKSAFRILNKKLLRSVPKAKYSTENIGHFGIASPCYTHFTSPIRRIDDLLNHTSITYILKYKSLEKKFIDSWNAYLNYVCETASENERNSEKCEYAVDDMLKADYMTHHIGEEFEGTVDSLLSRCFFVQTDNYIDGKCEMILKGDEEIPVISYYDYNENIMAYTRNNRVDLRYGDRVLVKCTASDPDKREIDFTLVRKL